MPASRRLWLALEIGLAALVVTLAAYGVSAGLRAVTSGDMPPAASPARAMPHGPQVPGPLESYAVIAARDVFNPLPDADRRLTDGLKLWGVGLHGARGHAVIEDVEARRQELYHVGDTVRGARIAAIAWDRVTLVRDGVEATLELAPPGERRGSEVAATAAASPPQAPERIRRTGADAFIVDRRELEGAASNMSGLMTQLRAVAEVADGRPAGFRLFQIKEDSVFRRLGIQDGDVVQRVNGAPVNDPTSLLAFLERLRSEPRVAVDIVRGGTARTLVYDLR
jgi:general secretion pathway protein C